MRTCCTCGHRSSQGGVPHSCNCRPRINGAHLGVFYDCGERCDAWGTCKNHPGFATSHTTRGHAFFWTMQRNGPQIKHSQPSSSSQHDIHQLRQAPLTQRNGSAKHSYIGLLRVQQPAPHRLLARQAHTHQRTSNRRHPGHNAHRPSANHSYLPREGTSAHMHAHSYPHTATTRRSGQA
jgi:hypothetical protein